MSDKELEAWFWAHPVFTAALLATMAALSVWWKIQRWRDIPTKEKSAYQERLEKK